MVPTVAFPPCTPFTFQVTFWFGIGVTVAVNCSVAAPDTEALVGDTVTTVGPLLPPPPPLPGWCAIHPTQTSRAKRVTDHDKTAGRNFRTGPSDSEKGIRNVGGRKREVYSVSFMLSRSVRPVNAKPQVEVSRIGCFRLVSSMRLLQSGKRARGSLKSSKSALLISLKTIALLPG